MSTDSLDELLVEGLQEAYYAEQQLVDALETLTDQTEFEDASRAFSEHREETQGHVERLETAFDQLGESAETKQERVVDALIDEHEQFTSDNSEGDVIDRYNIEVGQKTEHYEIATYGSLVSLAGRLGHEDVAETLKENLDEEEQALDKLSQVGDEFDKGKVADS